MQISIFKVFGNIKSFFRLLILLVILLTAVILSEYTSIYKFENLQNQKKLAKEIYTLERDDIEIANVQFHGKSSMLVHDGEMLSAYFEYDYVNQLVLTGGYQKQVNKLKYAIHDFNKAASAWYAQEPLTDEELQTRKEDFTQTYNQLMEQITSISLESLIYEKRRFYIQEALVFMILAGLLLGFFWISRRLSQVKRDVKALYALENEEPAEFFTIEAETVAKRMNRTSKSPTASNPAYLDPLTGINNYKGFIHEFSDKKSFKLGNYTAVCIFTIDKLNEFELQYSQDFIEAILKKVSFMLSLYRQHNDVIARLDHNQFAIMLSRQDKTSAINDCELIRKSVEETPFKTADGHSLTITLSGGFVQKLTTQSIEEVISKAAKVLSVSLQNGSNRIAQLRDKSVSMK